MTDKQEPKKVITIVVVADEEGVDTTHLKVVGYNYYEALGHIEMLKTSIIGYINKTTDEVEEAKTPKTLDDTDTTYEPKKNKTL